MLMAFVFVFRCLFGGKLTSKALNLRSREFLRVNHVDVAVNAKSFKAAFVGEK